MLASRCDIFRRRIGFIENFETDYATRFCLLRSWRWLPCMSSFLNSGDRVQIVGLMVYEIFLVTKNWSKSRIAVFILLNARIAFRVKTRFDIRLIIDCRSRNLLSEQVRIACIFTLSRFLSSVFGKYIRSSRIIICGGIYYLTHSLSGG